MALKQPPAINISPASHNLANRSDALKLGLMVPEFPGQTHVALWRVGQAMREMGVKVQWLSTRRNSSEAECHDFLTEEAAQAHYVYPPSIAAALQAMLRSLSGVLRSIRYVATLPESDLKGKLRCLLMLPCAADLKIYCQRQGIGHIFAHSCADMAHTVAMCRLLGGPTYSLRLGGDLKVYGRDHRAKMRDAAFIAAAAQATGQQVIDEVGIAAERVYGIWFGVDTQRFLPAQNRVYEPDQLRILTVARLNRTKGHCHALAAVKQLLDQGIDVHYTLIGSGPFEPDLRQMAADLDLSERVTFTGAQGEFKVIQALQSHDVFVLPSVGLGEASPVAVLEAMSCGLPAVCSIIGGTPDIVTDGVDGFLFQQKDEQRLTEQLLLLARDVQLRKQLSQAARDRAVEAFDCRSSARCILEAIKTHTAIDFTAQATLDV
jgi:glycosyltransferase involved in cell wall biosynthesis